ncbi:hypothetical protein [Pedosphaera parvula]|uniref:Uncharacterized protein n=1 Tax=Pedosphaera parvula (strain Ellin514) TaxID=320771 RepID=B9XC39_PEDPL|nr:hypothetical protein [Pedosphaera parvula]EEF62507.1 hypothetical protein Cflav_PD5142 [Pedosphaera parvula Ellin514]
MKSLLLPLLLFSLLSASAHAESLPVKLTGIINLPGEKEVLVEKTDAVDRSFVISNSEGQTEVFGKEIKCKILQIDTTNRTVKVNLTFNQSSTTNTLSLENNTKNSSNAYGIHLRNASLHRVQWLYSRFTNRTILQPSLSSATISCDADVTNETAAAQALSHALIQASLTNILDGRKFAMIVPIEHASMAHPGSSKIKTFTPLPPTSSTPPGLTRMFGADCTDSNLQETLKLYSMLIGRQLDRSAPLPDTSASFTFVTQTGMFKEEALYAFDTLYAWQNIKIIPIGKDLFQAVEIKSK